MHCQARNLTLKLLVFISLLTLIVQSACELNSTTISNENKEFISKVLGHWTVQEYKTTNNDTSIILSRVQDSLYINRYFPDYTYNTRFSYSIDDPVICTLPYIENIQNWKIIHNNDNLFLEIQDFCGASNNFNIYFDNIKYHEEYEFWGRTYPPHYSADLKLTNQYSEITIENLYIGESTYNYGVDWVQVMRFYIDHDFFRLVRHAK